MPTADLAPLSDQQASQHPRAGERGLQMQPVETPHDCEVGFRYWARQVVDAATADAQNVRLPGDRQSVDGPSALPSAIPPCSGPSKNRSPASALRSVVQRLLVNGGPLLRCRRRAQNIASSTLKLRLPRCDLVGVDVELLCQLSQCSIALDGGKRHLCFKAGVWFRRGRLVMVSPNSRRTACPPSGRNST